MKKIALVLPAVCLLAACAGNPPQWWNPSGSYGNDAVSASSSAGHTEPVRAAEPEEEPIPAEENIAAPSPDDSYEEMILTPLQDEETEDPADKTSQSQNTMDITPSAPESSGGLPVPSVLTE